MLTMPTVLKKTTPRALIALFLLPALVAFFGCDDTDDVSDADAGDGGEGDGGSAMAAESCINCHLDEERILASLEADPLPEEEDEEESTGEG